MKHLIFSLLFIATSLNLRGQDTIILDFSRFDLTD